MTAQILTPTYWALAAFNFFYFLVQRLIIWLFKPPPPPSPPNLDVPMKGTIAIVGAGLTGVACAAHAIVHGFDVVIYEQTGALGGIWATVSDSSGLWLPSFLYRFHPGVLWSCTFPQQEEIVRETYRIWEEYRLLSHMRFQTEVTSVKRVDQTARRRYQIKPSSEEAWPSKWTVNDGEDGEFDAVVIAVGTRGAPKHIDIPGLPQAERLNSVHPKWVKFRRNVQGPKPGEVFQGIALHWSELQTTEDFLEGQTVLVIGDSASGVEAVDIALARGAKHCIMVARRDKWIIRRNLFINTLIALRPFARQKWFSLLLEKVIKTLNYRGAPQLVPAHLGIFEDTPVVNDEFANWVREGRYEYVRGDVDRPTKQGLRVRVRGRDEMPGEDKEMREYEGDVLVYATGFSEPEMPFLKHELFPEGYKFLIEDWSVALMNPVTIGHWRIGINMRILLTFLKHPHARPTRKAMKTCVDNMRYYRQRVTARLGGESSILSYAELVIWLYTIYASGICGLKWIAFIMQGWGKLQ